MSTTLRVRSLLVGQRCVYARNVSSRLAWPSRSCTTLTRLREMAAEDYPDDDRNKQSAGALCDLAEWVRRLPDDDHRLAKLGDWMHLQALDVVSPSERGERETSR